VSAPPPPVAQRRRFVAGISLIVAVAAAWTALAGAGSSDRAGSDSGVDSGQGQLVVVDGERRLAELSLDRYVRGGRVDRVALARSLKQRLGRRTVRRGSATLVLHYDVAGTAARAARLGADGGRISAVRRVLSSKIDAPVLQQAQRNTCESAALEILLATKRVRVDQSALQAQLPTSGPLDPEGTGPSRIWGDPERGYVGRPDGGGVAGGFGVFQRPVAGVARRHDVRLEDLTRQEPATIYERLRAGRAVMVWVGLSDGPYGEWRSPEGRRVRVNFGEHTVVLTGIRRDGSVRVSNPLQGTAETWTPETFELMWQRLGRRALAA
jgi:uncharacterized protein YvpB